MLKSFLSVFAGPPGLILIGAILGAVGALWAARKQADFERELRQKSEQIAELNRRTLDAVTGGDSFCYIAVSVLDRNSNVGQLVVIHQGDHTLYDVTVRMVDLDRFEEVKGRLSLNALNYTDTNLNLGTLIAGHATFRGSLDLNKFPKRGFNIFFAARNGSFHQILRLTPIDGTWKQATRVFRNSETIFEKVDDGFPRNASGHVEW